MNLYHDAPSSFFSLAQIDYIFFVQVRDFKFMCPNDTVFDQENFICANWFEIDCRSSTFFYDKNLQLFQPNVEQNKTSSSSSSSLSSSSSSTEEPSEQQKRQQEQQLKQLMVLEEQQAAQVLKQQQVIDQHERRQQEHQVKKKTFYFQMSPSDLFSNLLANS